MAIDVASPLPSETCTCSAIRQAARHVTRAYDEALAPVGLGLNQYSILAKLDRYGAQGLQALADRLVMDRSTLGRLLQPLERRGVVAIDIDPTDRRGRVIEMTADGTALMRRAKPLWAMVEAQFAAAFGETEAAQLRIALKRATTMKLTVAPQGAEEITHATRSN